MDQVESYSSGSGFSGPDRSDWSALTTLTASFSVVGIYTPCPSLACPAGSSVISELLEAISWPASSPQHSLWVVLNRLHILGLYWEIECVWAKWPLWELHFEQLRASIAWALLVPSKIRFGFVTLGGVPPRRLGVTREHPTVVVCLEKFVSTLHREKTLTNSGY